MNNRSDGQLKNIGAFVAAALLTFLFAAAITAFLAGSATYREAKYNAAQVFAVELATGGDLDGDPAIALVDAPSLDALTRGGGRVVDGGDEDLLTVIAKPSGGASGFVRDIQSRMTDYQYNPSVQRLPYAAQSIGAQIRARGVKVLVVPGDIAKKAASWRKDVFGGLRRGGVIPAFANTTIAKRALNGTGMRPERYSLILTDDQGFGAIESVGAWKVIVTGADDQALVSAIDRGALAVTVAKDAFKDLVKRVASDADKNPALASDLRAKADKVSAWAETLPSEGEVPPKTPKPRPKPKPVAPPKPGPKTAPGPGAAPVAPRGSGGGGNGGGGNGGGGNGGGGNGGGGNGGGGNGGGPVTIPGN